MNHLMVFVKAPVPGRVKTRLCPPLSGEQAARLYTAFAQDTLELAEKVPGAAVEVVYAPGEGFASLTWIRSSPPIRHFPQRGRDLGERLASAFRTAFSKGAQKAVVIGSDMPHLSPETIAQAFALLDHADVSIGPAHDGGYYLIGLKQEQPGLFSGVTWSADKVFQETAARARQLGSRTAVLPTLPDIDTFSDLLRLSSGLQTSSAETCPATRNALADIELRATP